MVFNSSILFMIVALIVAAVAIYVLYSIILYQGGSKNGEELQLSTKNILEQVKVLFDTKEYALVELLATKYLDRVPGHVDVRTYLAKAYYEDGKYNLAIKHCNDVLRKKPNDLEVHELLGNCYIKKKFPAKALKEYEFVYERKKNDKKIVRTLAELCRQNEQLFMAIQAYRALVEILTVDQDIADVQLIIAELNEEAYDFPAAFEAYKSRLAIMPKDVETNKKLAELYIRINNYPVAIETLLYMLTFTTDPKTLLWIHEVLVDMFVETEDYEKAIEFSEKMLNLQGSDKFKIRNNIAEFNLKLDNFQDGILILEDLALMSQNGFDVTIELADAYIKNKEYTKARDRYLVLLDKATTREAKIVNGKMSEMYIKWAIDKTEESKIQDSFDLLNDAMQYNPINPEIFYMMGKNHFIQKNYTGAVEGANKALEYEKEDTNRAKYLLLLAEAHHELGNFFEEKKALTDLMKVDEKNSDGLFKLGLMYASQHDVKSAEEYFKKALVCNPEHLQAKYNLALIYENSNRERAKELYMEVLSVDPTFIEAKNALNDLSTTDYY